ncbi:protein HIRA [Planococcus citri]|uniref:protein HIRA n=1 Tax=Planococcus citri TaxID=170843 RepID=UPI0031F7966E
MQVLKPHWISHDGLPIFCIDIHPDNSRFVTGGQGTDSGRVVIWNFDTVLNEDAEFDENIPKMLCQIDSHLACVNCVRWSNSGKYFASGGDDKLIMIWSFAKYPQGNNAVFSSKGKVNVETWRCTSTLRGHSGDVLDMAWSPQDVWLATASVDNTIIIWDAAKFPEIVAILKGHSGLVKGVTWDPIGKYLSSQSEDKSLRIWRTVDWQTEVVITEPFENCGTTVALRHDWSPDGQYLVTAHAMNNAGPTSRIVERDGWKYDKDYVGHRKAVNCVRFSSNIVQRRTKKSSKDLQMCVCALGSRDNSVSIWLTGFLRPVVVMENLFSGPVLDLSWSSIGHNLLACSFDGTVALLKFTENEIGKTLSKQQKDMLYEKVYGTSTVGYRHSNAQIIENPVLEKLPEEAEKSASETILLNENEQKVNLTPTKVPLPVNNKQIETRTSDGRRRITPIFVAPAPDIGESPTPFKANSASAPFSSSSEERSKIVIEKREDVIVQPNVSTNCSGVANVVENEIIDPKIISQTEATSVAPSTTTSAVSSTVMNHKSWKRSLESSLNVVAAKQPRFSDVVQVQDNQMNDKKLPIMAAGDISQKNIVLPPMRMDKKAAITVPDNRRALLINESHPGIRGTIARIKLTSKESDLWENVFGSLIIGCVANREVIVIALENRNLFILETNSGKHVLPPLVLSARASHLLLTDKYLLCITCTGLLSLWDIDKLKVIVSEKSLSSILRSTQEIFVNKSFISEHGVPMLALSNGKSYMYSVDLDSWLQLGDNTDTVVSNSMQKMRQNVLRSTDRAESRFPLHSLQTQSLSFNNSSRLLQNTDINVLCTYTFLEQQISAALALKSATEFKHWLLTLVQFLLNQGESRRLRLICEELLGPCHEHAKDPGNILGLPKRQLLKDVLAEISNSVHAQRLYTEFSDQLSALEEEGM